MKTLKATTPHGIFNRKTANQYTHIVVRVSESSQRALQENRKGSGTWGRWAKDNGFIVSWHRGFDNAQKASKQKACGVSESTMLGIFPVDAE